MTSSTGLLEGGALGGDHRHQFVRGFDERRGSFVLQLGGQGVDIDAGRKPESTGQGLAFQISAAYSAMVRSLENFPQLATFTMALRTHAPDSAYNSSNLWSARCM